MVAAPSDIVEVVKQVQLDFRNSRAYGRVAGIRAPERGFSGWQVGGQSAAQYALDDIDVCPSPVQRTLEVDLSALEKGHSQCRLHTACLWRLSCRLGTEQ
jgi:hypothetical protein